MSEIPGEEFVGKSMAKIFGAPISWIALFGALFGAMTIVPMLFYPTGGGYIAASHVIFLPLAGMILGPGGGLIAGMIGGIIGMFISPAAFPLGIIDAIFMGALPGFYFGILHPRFRKYAIPVFIVNILLMQFVPYYFPGKAGGYDQVTNHLQYFLSISWGWIGFLVYIFALKPIFRAMTHPNLFIRMVSYTLYLFTGVAVQMLSATWIYLLVLHFPLPAGLLNNTGNWILVAPWPIPPGIIAALLIPAIEKTGLPKIIGSVLDRKGF